MSRIQEAENDVDMGQSNIGGQVNKRARMSGKGATVLTEYVIVIGHGETKLCMKFAKSGKRIVSQTVAVPSSAGGWIRRSWRGGTRVLGWREGSMVV